MKETLVGRPHRIRLMPRDLRLMFSMYRNQFLTAEDVRLRFWEAKDTKDHYKRLRFLVRAGLIGRLQVFDGGDSAYRITSAGLTKLKQVGLVDPSADYRIKSYSTQFEHDKTLSRLIWRLENCDFVTCVENERDMRIRYRQKIEAFKKGQDEFKIPDARLICQTSESASIDIAVELELTIKSLGRYSRIFNNYQRLSDWKVLLYIVPSPNARESLSGIIETLYRRRSSTTALCNSAPIGIALLPEIMEAPENVPCLVRGRTFSLVDIVQKWPIENPYSKPHKAHSNPPTLITSVKESSLK